MPKSGTPSEAAWVLLKQSAEKSEMAPEAAWVLQSESQSVLPI